MLRLLAVLGGLCLVSCSTPRRHFIPREDVRAQSPRGWPAAVYPLTIAGQNAGEAKIWSEGTFRADIDDDERTVLHIGYELENRSEGELDFDVDQCRVTDLQTEDGRLADLGAHGESGTLHVAAGQVGLIDLEFVLPRDTAPRDVISFRVDWSLATKGGTFSQSTPFRIDTARYYRPRYYYYDPYYDPWWGWSFGTGFAVGHLSSRIWWGPRWHHRHW